MIKNIDSQSIHFDFKELEYLGWQMTKQQRVLIINRMISYVAVVAYIIIIFIFIVIVIFVNKPLQDTRLYRLLLFSFVVFCLFSVRHVAFPVVFST